MKKKTREKYKRRNNLVKAKRYGRKNIRKEGNKEMIEKDRIWVCEELKKYIRKKETRKENSARKWKIELI